MGPSGLKVYYTNTRSVKGKLTDIQSITDTDIICLTETHLDSSIYSGELLDPRIYNIHRKDRNIHGGGVLIAIKNEITHEAVPQLLSHEAVAVVIAKDLVLVCAYRPPQMWSRVIWKIC